MDISAILKNENIDVTSLLEQLSGYLLIKDRNSKFIFSCDKTAKLFGFKNSEHMIGLADYDLKCQASEDADEFRIQDQHAIHHSEGNYLCYYGYADGWKITLTNKSKILSNDNKIIGVSCYISDITDQYLLDLSYYLIKSDVYPKNINKKNCFSYKLNDSNIDETLTDRQLECLFFLLRGKSIKSIAKTLKLSHRTVEQHVDTIKHKFDCINKSQLIEKCWAKGYMNILPKSLINSADKDKFNI